MNSLSIIIHSILFFTIITYVFLYIKGKIIKIMFHPLIAILIGIIVTVEMFVLSQAFLLYIHLYQLLTFPIAVFIGSLVATLLSKKNTALIGIFIGIIFAIFVSIVVLVYGSKSDFYDNILFMAVVFILSLISSGIGGYTAKKIRDLGKNKQTNRKTTQRS